MNDKTLGAYTRHESPDYADGGVTAALIEQEAQQPTAEVRELRSALAREIERGNALQDALDAAESRPLAPDAPECDRHIAHIATQDRVLRHRNRTIRDLTQERDEARRERGEALDRLCEASRPLTPDAITDEMVERARDAFTKHSSVHVTIGPDLVRKTITAALTEPTPHRPEWADLGEALDRFWPDCTDGISREDIARRLHTEAGVRVVGENEDPHA